VRRDLSTYDRALQLLAVRARSVAELRRALLAKGAEAPEVDEVLLRLQDQKLLDDAEYARQFARNKVISAGASRLRVVRDLGRKGIARSVADAAFDALPDTEGLDTESTVHRVAEKKWRSLARFDDITRRRRLYAFLARRGFNPDEIRTAMEKLGESEDL